MENILKLLYNGDLREANRSVEDLSDTEEWKQRDVCYEKLWETFSDSQKKLFEDFYLFDGGCIGLENERAYINGFKTGALMMLEIFNFKP